ncbi:MULTISPECIES: FG-GAP and VCBS repeat-containing protein [Streptomyces]|uniref:FG-GAP repeat protein n=2 Tax=Streptomyces TaxID=1883 RepID=A0ABV9J532_9ACTN
MSSKRLTSASRTRSLRLSAAATAAVLLPLGATITATAATAAPAPAAHDDFNHDGYPDLVVSAPGGTVSAQKGAGYVAVLYGSASGISTSRRATFSLSTPGVPGVAQAGDGFGRTTASGDLDGDGYADLVVGAPGKDIGTAADAGAAVVLWGSATGLRSDGALWLRDSSPVPGDRFGTGLATGRFRGTGTGTELGVLHKKDLRTYSFDATGRDRHASAAAPVPWHWDQDFTPAGLTSSDYNKDGADDLVLLGTFTEYEGYYPAETHGSASYLPGGPQGLSYGHYVPGGPTGASGDINKDGYADLVMGSPADRDDLSGALLDGGSIDVVLGGPDGPGAPGSASHRRWTQDSPGVPGTDFVGDRFGGAVSVGDVNGDGYADAAIGAPGNNVRTNDAGTVWIMRGSATGLTSNGSKTISQDLSSVPGTAEKADRFGGAVRLIDTNTNGKAELIASAPGEDSYDGADWIFTGTSNGLTTTGSWSFNGARIRAPYVDALFGATLAP